MRSYFRLLPTIGTAFYILLYSQGVGAVSAAPYKHQEQRIQLEAPTLAPMAYVRFCMEYHDECEVHHMKSALGLTRERWTDVVKVNAEVNRAIRPQPNDGGVLAERWLVAPPAGNCHDYAVTKRHELLALGWPSRVLLLAEVVTGWGEHHLVLVIRTRDGDLVADNLNANIRPWFASRYRWVRMQSPRNPKFWSKVAEVSSPASPALAHLKLGLANSDVIVEADEGDVASVASDASPLTGSLGTAPIDMVGAQGADGQYAGLADVADASGIAKASASNGASSDAGSADDLVDETRRGFAAAERNSATETMVSSTLGEGMVETLLPLGDDLAKLWRDDMNSQLGRLATRVDASLGAFENAVLVAAAFYQLQI